MSSFWSLKIGKSKQDTKHPVKNDRKGNNSSRKPSSEIVRSLMERALTDAEQLVDSIKLKAQKEAEVEIARIIEQARLGKMETGLNQLKTEVEPVFTEEPELTVTEPTTDEKSETETTEPAAIETEEPQAEIEPEPAVTVEPETDIIRPAVVETEEPQADIEPEPTETTTDELPEQPDEKEETGEEQPSPATIEMDMDAMYSEDVELAIAVPVDPVAVSKLYNNLQMTPEIKILYTRGSWDRGTVITVTLEKPIPLMDIISSIPDVEVKTIEPQKKDTIKGAPSTLLGGDKSQITRIDLQMKAK